MSSQGRFISEDSWEGKQHTAPSLHKYLYSYQNPTVYVDPDGRAPVLAEITNGLMSQVDYINSQAAQYRQKEGGLSGHLKATMMNVGAGVHAVLGGAVGLVNTVADVGISGTASGLEAAGVEFQEYGVVSDSRAHLSNVGSALKKAGHTAANFHDRDIRAELGRGGVETAMAALNGDPNALNRVGTAFTNIGAGGAFSKLNPVKLPSNTPSNSGPNVSLVTENPSGITVRVNSNRQANSAQYARLKEHYASLDQSRGNAGFYVGPSGPSSTLPATGYRYGRFRNDDGSINQHVDDTFTESAGPVTYFGFNKYNSGSAARSAYQIKGKEIGPDSNGAGSWSDARLRAQFDTLQLYENGTPQVRVPFHKGDSNKSKLEPYTNAYRQYGKGGQTQLHADDKIIEFDDVKVLPE